MNTTYLILGAAGFVLIAAVLMYNSLVGAKNQVENAFGSIDVMLKKRYDLIPNLLETVKAYMKHESDVLTRITDLRTKAMSRNATADEKVQLENQISGMVKGLMVQVENYPDLKASEQFTMLQRSWNETEEQISAARRSYNASVTQYNNAVEKFPSSLFAAIFSYRRKEVFVIEAVERQNINAKALFNA